MKRVNYRNKKVNYRNAIASVLKRYGEYYKGCGNSLEATRTYIRNLHDKEFEKDISEHILNIWDMERQRKLQHLFIKDDTLFVFFENTKIKTNDALKRLVSENEQGYFVVHSKTISFAFKVFVQNGELWAFTIEESPDGTDNCEVRCNGCSEQFFNDVGFSKPRMAINILCYMSAFPDQVKDGVPDDYRASSVGSIKNKIIGKTHKIVHTSSEKSTHFRSGFFRHYPKDSSYYKNVAGTTQWINATVVNGRAKTILGETNERLD